MTFTNPENILYEYLKDTGYPTYPLRAPENETNPLIIYSVSSRVIDTQMNDNSIGKRDEVRFNISGYCDSFRDMKTMEDAIFENINKINNEEDFSIVIYGSKHSSDEDGFRTIIDAKIYQKIQ